MYSIFVSEYIRSKLAMITTSEHPAHRFEINLYKFSVGVYDILADNLFYAKYIIFIIL